MDHGFNAVKFMLTPPCAYISPDGIACDEPAGSSGYCFWHDHDIVKDTGDICQKLEARALTGKPMCGFSLRKARLHGVNLVRPGSCKGYDLRWADLYRADLREAHLFGIQLQHASLMKADMSACNLHGANVENSNLLGVILQDAKVEYVNWGKMLIQDEYARIAEYKSENKKAIIYFQQAEEIYRKLRLHTERQGLPQMAGFFFQHEMAMRRRQKPMFSPERILSKAVDLFCGYGEKPLRVIVFSLTLIILSAFAYFFAGLSFGEDVIGFDLHQGVSNNFYDFLECLYFSVITFTTLGYGDIVPTEISRIFAAIEAFCGSFTLALFVVVFVKKMTR